MSKRKKLNESTFGEKMAPIIANMCEAFLEHDILFEGEKKDFPKQSLSQITRIFTTVLIDSMFNLQEKEKMPYKNRYDMAEYAITTIHKLVLEMTGVDLKKD